MEPREWQEIAAPQSNFQSSHDVSPMTGPSSYLAQIWHLLGRLEAGQVLNRKSSEQQVLSLAHHIDTRLEDLRTGFADRMDRLETRLETIEQRPANSNPWWRDMGHKEWLAWLAVTVVGIIAIREPTLAVSLLERMLGSALK